MDRLCVEYHIKETVNNGVMVLRPGMVYDISEIKEDKALVRGMWVPANVFNQKEIKDLYR